MIYGDNDERSVHVVQGWYLGEADFNLKKRLKSHIHITSLWQWKYRNDCTLRVQTYMGMVIKKRQWWLNGFNTLEKSILSRDWMFSPKICYFCYYGILCDGTHVSLNLCFEWENPYKLAPFYKTYLNKLHTINFNLLPSKFTSFCQIHNVFAQLGPILLTWFNLIPSMNKLSYSSCWIISLIYS